jgi:amidohydrolase
MSSGRNPVKETVVEKDGKKYKTLAFDDIQRHDSWLVGISEAIHQNPEVGLKEYGACELLTTRATELGFEVETGLAGMDTAFVARYGGEKPGPRIAFLAEYDALADLGHGCGHNIIAAAAIGAAAGLRQVVAEVGGTVLLYGTPDEEAFGPDSRGGKVLMADAGLFDDIDAALMMHPIGGESAVWRYSFPLKDFTVTFHGRPAHYTLPHEGINALEALLLFIDAVNTLKRGWQPSVMFAYTITDGGGPSPITVPGRAQAHVTMKSFYSRHLEAMFDAVCICARQVSEMTGATATIRVLGEYRNTIPNLTLTGSLYRNMLLLGEPVEHPDLSKKHLERLTYPGISTDFGNVSWCVPGIHGYCSIGGTDLIAHTPAFAAAAGSAPGHRAMMMSARAMAAVGVDILTDPDLARGLRAEFERYRLADFSNVPGIPPDFLDFHHKFE